jgi:hypothetical protein
MLQQHDELESITMKFDSKSHIEQEIKEGMINWMEYAAHSVWWAAGDCSKVLLNYIDREGELEEDEILKKHGGA